MNYELLSKLKKINKEYQKDVKDVEECIDYEDIRDNMGLAGAYMFFRMLYVFKWLERKGIEVEKNTLFAPEYSRNDIECWNEDVFFHMEMNEDEIISLIESLFPKLGWFVEYFPFPENDVERKDYAEITREILYERLGSDAKDVFEQMEGDREFSYGEFYYILILHERLGKYLIFAKGKPEVRRTKLHKTIEDIVTYIHCGTYIYFTGSDYEILNDRGYCALWTAGALTDGSYLSFGKFDFVNIIRAYYLEKYLDIANEMYSYL